MNNDRYKIKFPPMGPIHTPDGVKRLTGWEKSVDDTTTIVEVSNKPEKLDLLSSLPELVEESSDMHRAHGNWWAWQLLNVVARQGNKIEYIDEAIKESDYERIISVIETKIDTETLSDQDLSVLEKITAFRNAVEATSLRLAARCERWQESQVIRGVLEGPYISSAAISAGLYRVSHTGRKSPLSIVRSIRTISCTRTLSNGTLVTGLGDVLWQPSIPESES